MSTAVELPSFLELGRAIRAGETTSEAATERCLGVIRDRDRSINAFITVLADAALDAARTADRELRAGQDRGPLHGVPISIKDILDMAGLRTTAASHVRREHVAARDATVIARLRDAGAVMVGKTNLHEFALGTTNEESAYGPVHHPLDATRSPGGSSGGSAASVLAGMAYASIGTDTGGSIRIPSAACGLVGLKPRFREVPTQGVVPLSASLDHVGPLCATVADAAAIFRIIADAPLLDGPLQPGAARGVRLGVPRRYFFELLDDDVASAFDATCARLAAAGVAIDDVVIPHASQIPAAYLHVALTEAAAFHATALESRPDDYTPTVRARLEAGRYVLAEDYLRALRGCGVLRAEVSAALDGRDALLLPSLAVPATPLGAATVRVSGTDEPVRNVTLRLTQLFNLTGHPAITVPCGATGGGLPIGAQLVGASTAALLQTATTLESHIRGRGTSSRP
ncbi:MAG TPA: amidase [Vicinamibacterales bacterium]|nr:amidase [Vicinamibacterales bacterium]